MIEIERAKKIYKEKEPNAILLGYGEIKGYGIYFYDFFPNLYDAFTYIDFDYKIVSIFVPLHTTMNLPPVEFVDNCFDEEEEKHLRSVIREYDQKREIGAFEREVINGKNVEDFISDLKKFQG